MKRLIVLSLFIVTCSLLIVSCPNPWVEKILEPFNREKPFTVTVVNGTGSGEYTHPETVRITANWPPSGQVFINWTANTGDVRLEDANSRITTFTMPREDVKVTANFGSPVDLPIPPTPPVPPPPVGTYLVTVNNGTGGGYKEAGASVTITANTPPLGMQFKDWTINLGGITLPTTSTVTFTMPSNDVTVTANFESLATITLTGTVTSTDLQTEIDNIEDGGTIIFDADTVIEATSRVSITGKNITIEGNGAVWTRDSSWTTNGLYSQFLQIGSGSTVKVSGVYFTGGRAQANGGAISVSGGELTIESCIFSDNRINSAGATAPYGGVIYVSGSGGKAIIKGCTFYDNSNTIGSGSAIYVATNSFLELTGNLFYQNTPAATRRVVHILTAGNFTSGSYNVFDVPYGVGNGLAGFEATATDTTFSDLGITGDPFNTTTFKPVPELYIMPSTPISGFPTTDFYGDTRDWSGAAGAVK